MTRQPSDRSLPSRDAEALWVVDESNSVRAFDGRTDRLVAKIDLGSPGDTRWWLEAGGGYVWAFGLNGAMVLVDPVAAQVVASPSIGPRPARGVLGMPHYAHGAMWIWGEGSVWRVTGPGEVSTAAVASDDRPAGGPGLAAATDRWVFFGCGRRLLRIDPATGGVTDESERLSIALERAGIPRAGVLASMAAGAEGLVVAMGHNQPDIIVLDPDTVEPKWATRVPDGSAHVTLHEGGTDVWALSAGTAMLVADDAAGQPRLVQLHGAQVPLAVVALESLWVVHEIDRVLTRLHLPAGRIVQQWAIPDEFLANPSLRLVAGEHTVWLISRIDSYSEGVYRVDLDANRLVRVDQPDGFNDARAVVAAGPRYR